MSISFVAETNIGQKRQVNEDSLWPRTRQHNHLPSEPYGMLFVVADGMGGHGAGDIASSLAVAEIAERYYTVGSDYPGIAERLEFAILSAHRLICDRAPQSAETQDMGSTVAAAVVKFDEARYRGEVWVAWVGDSRVYLSRRGQLQQLSRDHSRVWPLIEAGQITWDELHFHPDRSKITNALTPRRPNAAPEILRFDLEPGDKLLLCSDGLSGEVRPEELSQILATYPPEQAAPLLIERANAPKDLYANGQQHRVEGGNDNISVIIVQLPADQTETQPMSELSLPTVLVKPQPVTAAPPPAPKKSTKKSSRWGLILVVGLLLVVLAGGGGLFFALSGATNTPPPPPVTVAAGPPPAETAASAQKAIIVAVDSTQTPAPVEPSATALEVPVNAAETRVPTVTRAPTASPTATFTPSPSPTPSPTATPLITTTAVITVDVTALVTPTLLLPNPDGTGKNSFDISQPITFSWDWPGELPADFGFEIRVWLRGSEPTGAHNALLLKQESSYQHLPGDTVYSVALVLSGVKGVTATSADYLWSVGVVRLNPQYEWLNIAAAPRPISLVVPNAPGSAGTRPQ